MKDKLHISINLSKKVYDQSIDDKGIGNERGWQWSIKHKLVLERKSKKGVKRSIKSQSHLAKNKI